MWWFNRRCGRGDVRGESGVQGFQGLEQLEPRLFFSAAPVALDPSVFDATGQETAIIASLVAGAGEAQSVTGPLTIEGFHREGDRLMADGSVLLPGGEAVEFSTRADVVVRQAGDGASATILDLTLGPVDLDLLGLRVDLDRVALQVTAQAGPGQVLGNVLTELLLEDPERGLDAVSGALTTALAGGDGLMDALPLSESLRELDAGVDYDALASGASLLERAEAIWAQPLEIEGDLASSARLAGDGAGEAAGVASSLTSLPDEVRVLTLSIEELDLHVLGLRVQTLAPVDLSVTAEAGPGRLLGNLFVGLSSLLDPLLPEASGEVPMPRPMMPPTVSSLESMGADEVPIIGLELRNVDLYLLGLEANLDVDLLVGLQPGKGNLLGNLLLSELEQIEREVVEADFSPLENLLGFLFNGNGMAGGGAGGGTVGGVLGASMNSDGPATLASLSSPAAGEESSGERIAAATLPATAATAATAASVMRADTDPLMLLDLSIDELDLDLLGVLIRSQGISLELSADPAPGALLGNLLGRLLGAFESGGGGGGGDGGDGGGGDDGGMMPDEPATGPTATSLIQAEAFDSARDVQTNSGAVSFFNDGDFLLYRNVDFGSGVNTFNARLAVPNDRPGQAIEVRLDAPDGEVVGSLTPRGTGGFGTFVEQSTPIIPVSGVRDLYLVGRGTAPDRGIANIDAFTFSSAAAPAPAITPATFALASAVGDQLDRDAAEGQRVTGSDQTTAELGIAPATRPVVETASVESVAANRSPISPAAWYAMSRPLPYNPLTGNDFWSDDESSEDEPWWKRDAALSSERRE